MGFSKTVHHRDPRNPSVFTKVTPYALFRTEGSVSIYLQDGKFYYENGKHINDPPQWAIEQAENLSDVVKKQVGWQGIPAKRGRPPKEKVDGDNQSDSTVDSEGRQ